MELNLTGLTFQGSEVVDPSLLESLPKSLVSLLKAINGFVAFQGGLHVRGICKTNEWHSLQAAWKGENAIHNFYSDVRHGDIPFAQDCVGDQFLLRDNTVIRLSAEDGAVQNIDMNLNQFLSAAQADPIGFLSLEPLMQFHNEGKKLAPGELIHVYPPFCTAESANGVSLHPVPALELIQFHAQFAAQLPPDGARVELDIFDKKMSEDEPASIFPSGLDFFLLMLNIRVEKLATKTGNVVEVWEEDGLGTMRGFPLELDNGCVVLVRESDHGREHFKHPGPTIQIDVGNAVQHGYSKMRQKTLEALSITPKEIYAEPEDLTVWKSEAAKDLANAKAFRRKK